MRILGRKGKGGGGGSKFREDPNNLKSVSTAKVLDLISEGEIGGLVNGAQSIYFDDVPLQNADGTYNFDGVSVEIRDGLPDQDYIPGFSNVETFMGVGATVKHGMPITHSFVDENADAVIVTMSFPALSQTDTSSGSVLAYEVHFKVELRADDGTWWDSGDIGVFGKCVSEFQRSYYFKLPQSQYGRYDIRVTRISTDSETSTKNNIINWFGFTKVIEARLNYPNRAMCGITVRADQFGSNVPTRKYEIYGLVIKVPSNYDAWTHTYDGVWDGTFKRSWTNNPAWIFYDLLTNARYGLGRDIKPEYIDKYGLYMIGRYCDEMVSDGKGGEEPRFTFNGVINSRESAYSVLNNLAGTFNSMLYYSGTSIVLVQDSPKTPVRDFTPANVIDGQFNYEGTGRSSRHSIFQVAWSNPEKLFNAEIESIESPDMIQDTGWNVNEIILLGCTSRGQARRRAMRDLYTEQHETETVTFSVGVENADIAPGDIIRVFDPSYAGARYGGRIKSINTQTNMVELDDQFDFTIGSNWFIGLLLPDNTWIEAPLNLPDGITNRVAIAQVLEQYPEVGSVFTLRCDNVEPRLFRVLSIKEDKPYQFVIIALLHYEQKYDVIEKGAEFIDGNFTTIPSGAIKSPINLAAEQYVHRVGNNVMISIITSWQNDDPRASSFLVRYKHENASVWTELGYTSSETATIDDTQEGKYEIQVQAIDALGRRSAFAEIVYDAPGYNTIPSDVTGLTYRISSAIGVIWSWNISPDFDFSHFLVSVTNENGTITTGEPTYRSAPYNFTGLMTASVKAVNLAGNESANPATGSVEILPPKKPTVISAELLDSGFNVKWTDCFEMFDTSAYRIRSCRGTDVQLTQNTSMVYAKPAGWMKDDTLTVQCKDIFSNWGEESDVTPIKWYAPKTPDFKLGCNPLTGGITVDWEDCRNDVDDAPSIAYYEIIGTLANQTNVSGVVSVIGTHYESVVPLTAYEYGTEIENGIEIQVGTLSIGVMAVDKYGITSKDDPNYVDNTKQFKLYPPYMPTNMALTSSNEGDSVVLSWKDCERTFAIDYYQVYDEYSKTTYKVATNYVVLPSRKEGTYNITIQAFDVVGHSSPVANYTMMISGVGGMVVDATIDGSDILIQWSIPDASFTLDRYIIKSDNDKIPTDPDDVSFDDGELLGTAKVNYFRTPAGKAGTYTFYVWAVDVAGNISTNYASYTSITITPPSAPIVRATSTGRAIHIDWTTEVDQTAGQLPLVSYDVVRFQMDYSTGILEPHEQIYGNFTQDNVDVDPLPVLDYDKYYFRVRAWDTGGNHSDSWGECDFLVLPPNTPFFNEVQVVVNAVMFWWSEPKVTTFNIDRYRMYLIEEGVPKMIGETDALYATRTESYNEQYTYGISAIDLAGNESAMALTIQEVDAPAGFVLYWNKNSKFDGDRTNMVLDGRGNLIGPVPNDETWLENIDRIGLGDDITWVQKISASQVWLGPRVELGVYEEIIDIGTMIPTSKITITPIKTVLEGDPTIRCLITTSQDGVNWEPWSESFQLYAINFTHVKYRIEVTDGIVAFHNINYKLDMQRKQDFLTTQVLASDCYDPVVYIVDENDKPILGEDGFPIVDMEKSVRKANELTGTWVPFNIKFTDVEVPISAEPVEGSTGLNPLVVFEDVVNPQGFYLSLWNKKGEPVNGKVQWFALGV